MVLSIFVIDSKFIERVGTEIVLLQVKRWKLLMRDPFFTKYAR